jgi:hypothetical protein
LHQVHTSILQGRCRMLGLMEMKILFTWITNALSCHLLRIPRPQGKSYNLG